MRSKRGQELVQAAMTLPVLTLIIIMSCWLVLWELGLHSTQFVVQEAARAANASTGLASDPDAVGIADSDDTDGSTDVAVVASTAQSAAQNAIDSSFLHGYAAGSPCPVTPAAGHVCFIQEPACTQGGGSGSTYCDNQGVPQCLNGASPQTSLWVCEWYEVPVGPATTYRVKIVVAGWYDVGSPFFGGMMPIASVDEESIQRCGGCPG
jgi:hypothetical protein